MSGELDNHNIPEYLSVIFFENALTVGLKLFNVKIINLKLTEALAKGENYCSDIYRANIDYESSIDKNCNISLIIKCLPHLEHRGPILDDLQSYQKEVDMYTTIIPSISALLKNEFFSAKCLYTTEEPVKVIVFQDLLSIGFTMADRKDGLDLNHCKLVLQKMAKFHAGSLVYAQKNPKKMENFKYGMFNPQTKIREIYDSIFGKGLETFITVVEKWSGYEKITEKLKIIDKDFFTKMIKCSLNEKDQFKVINHGDMWVNNCMFQYNKEMGPTDIVFVDFQMCYFASPGIDINYFLNSSPKFDVREKNRDEMVEYYYEIFSKTLKSLNYKNIPTFEKILNEIKSKEFYGFVTAIGILPIVLMEKQAEQSGLDAFMDEDMSAKIRFLSYNNQKYQQAMKHILKRFYELNVLDY